MLSCLHTEKGSSQWTCLRNSSANRSDRLKHEHAAQRFDHCEVVLDKEGQPLELGRGAMGITYKALDINLQCPVH
jgi:hypothetical protein